MHNTPPCGGKGLCAECAKRATCARNDFVALTTDAPVGGWIGVTGVAGAGIGDGCFDIVVDIGTTTLAFALLQGGRVLYTHARANSQRAFGHDVISRIQAAGDGRSRALYDRIHADLRDGTAQLLAEAGTVADNVRTFVVAGNTTMLHLLTGTDCTTLGQFPFTPVFLDGRVIEDSPVGIPMTLLPGISAFVGADIVAGLLYCAGLGKSRWLLIDLGTNGEIAFSTPDGIWVTAAAAGPAFEAANISCGMPGVPGAVAHAVCEDGRFAVKTIGNAPPVGLCGSGVLDVAAQLVRHGLVDETGGMADAYFETGVPITDRIHFTQQDLRELQLAKSAIRTGIELLLSEAGASCHEVEAVYLAGGLGHALSQESAFDLGLLPRAFAGKTVAAGNTALAGGIASLGAPTENLENIVRTAKELQLATHPRFNDAFLTHIMFEK